MRWSWFLVLCACGGGGNGAGDARGPDAPRSDAAVDGARDGAVDGAPDAAPDGAVDATPDAAIDAMPDAPAVGMITLHLARAGVPRAGVPIYIQPDPTAASVTTLATDANGDLTATITGGSYLSLVDPGWITPQDGYSSAPHILTFTDLQPGDTFDVDYGGPPAVAQPSFTVTGVAGVPGSGALVGSVCGGDGNAGGPLVTVTPTTRVCPPTGPLVYVPVVDTINGEFATGSIFLPNAPLDGTPIDTTGRPVASIVDHFYSLLNAGTSVATFQEGVWLWGAFPYDGASQAIHNNEAWPLPTLGDVPARYRYASFRIGTGSGDERWLLDWGGPGDVTCDASQFPAAMTAQAFDPATRAGHWTWGAGTRPDAVRMRVYSPASNVMWDLVGPAPASGQLAIPHLPPGVDRDLPSEQVFNVRGYLASGGVSMVRWFVGHQLDAPTLGLSLSAGTLRVRSVGDTTLP